VLRSAAGHYIGTADDDGPVSRESVEYFPTRTTPHSAPWQPMPLDSSALTPDSHHFRSLS
jgi:hypothetical protein